MINRPKSNYSGFTLIEILVVLGIITLLSALLFGVFSRVRERGHSSLCQSNLQQIGLAIRQYTQDSDGQFPSQGYAINRDTPAATAVRWNDVIMPYVKDAAIFQCPTSGNREERDPDYVYNWPQLNEIERHARIKDNRLLGTHEAKLTAASEIMLNSDAWMLYGDGELVNGTEIETSCGTRMLGTLHSGGANFSYVDGHVKWVSQAQQAEAICATTPTSSNE